jgi:hypothetical protein
MKNKKITIVANSIEDFEKQYYCNAGINSPLDISIELNTDDSFWSELINSALKNTIITINENLLKENITANDFKTIFCPKYGNITYINKSIKDAAEN